MSLLPNDIWIIIFDYNTNSENYKLMLVSKKFYTLLHSCAIYSQTLDDFGHLYFDKLNFFTTHTNYFEHVLLHQHKNTYGDNSHIDKIFEFINAMLSYEKMFYIVGNFAEQIAIEMFHNKKIESKPNIFNSKSSIDVVCIGNHDEQYIQEIIMKIIDNLFPNKILYFDEDFNLSFDVSFSNLNLGTAIKIKISFRCVLTIEHYVASADFPISKCLIYKYNNEYELCITDTAMFATTHNVMLIYDTYTDAHNAKILKYSEQMFTIICINPWQHISSTEITDIFINSVYIMNYNRYGDIYGYFGYIPSNSFSKFYVKNMRLVDFIDEHKTYLIKNKYKNEIDNLHLLQFVKKYEFQCEKKHILTNKTKYNKITFTEHFSDIDIKHHEFIKNYIKKMVVLKKIDDNKTSMVKKNCEFEHNYIESSEYKIVSFVKSLIHTQLSKMDLFSNSPVIRTVHNAYTHGKFSHKQLFDARRYYFCLYFCNKKKTKNRRYYYDDEYELYEQNKYIEMDSNKKSFIAKKKK